MKNLFQSSFNCIKAIQGSVFQGPPSSHNKKLLLTSMLVALLSAPYLFQDSKDDFGVIEMSQTAAPDLTVAQLEEKLAAAKKAAEVKEAAAKLAQENKDRIKKLEAELAEAKKMSPPVVTTAAAKTPEQLKIEEQEAEIKRLKSISDNKETEKKKAAEAKRIKEEDCDDYDKTKKQKRECLKDKKEVAQEELTEKFKDEVAEIKENCEEKTYPIQCMSTSFSKVLKSYSKKDASGALLASKDAERYFNMYLGEEFKAAIFSGNEEERSKGLMALQNLFGSSIPSRFATFKNRFMTSIADTAKKNARIVEREFKEYRSLKAKKDPATDSQLVVATSLRDELVQNIEQIDASVGRIIQGDQNGFAHYRHTFVPQMNLILKALYGTNTQTIADPDAVVNRKNSRGSTQAEVVGTTAEASRTGTRADNSNIKYDANGTTVGFTVGEKTKEKLENPREGRRLK